MTAWPALFLLAAALAAGQETPPPEGVPAPAPETAPEPVPPAQAPGEAPLLDLGKIDTSEVRPLQFHGRVDLTLAFLEGDNLVDDFRQRDVLPLSPGLFLGYRFLRIFEAELEVEWDGLEEEVEVDRALLEVDPLHEHLVLKVGRDIIPFGIERFSYAPSSNVLVDRPAAFRAVFPGTFSDYLVSLGGRYRHPDGWGIGYESALSLGLQSDYDQEGLPEPLEDHNQNKQFTGRLSFSPDSHLTVGASYLVGEYDRDDSLQVDFLGFDASYELYGVNFRAEWVGGGVERLPQDGGKLSRHGWYFLVDRRWDLPWEHPQAVETAFRYDDIDPDNTVRDQRDLRRYSFGLNLVILSGLRWKNEFQITDERHDDFANNGYYTQLEFHW